MARKSPKQILSDLETVLNAVTELAPDKTFGGLTITQFETQVTKSFDTRKELVNAEINVTNIINKRDNVDDESLKMRELIINGIIGDPDFGPDSTLYERCGYIRKSDRKSGLTRKVNKKSEDEKE